MNESKTPTVLQTALFAIFLDGILLVLGWLWIGPPQTMAPISSYKSTAIIGLPTITQLLEPRHQFSMIGFQRFGTLHVIVTCLMYVLFLLASSYYIALVARIRRNLPTSPTQDAKRAWPTLLLWMVLQFLIMAILSFGISLFGQSITRVVGTFGLGMIVILPMLAFRFWFLYVEYAITVLHMNLRHAMQRARTLLRLSLAESFWRFLTLCIVSFVLSYAINRFFNVPVLMGVLVLNALVQTWLQTGLMESFFRAQERLQGDGEVLY